MTVRALIEQLEGVDAEYGNIPIQIELLSDYGDLIKRDHIYLRIDQVEDNMGENHPEAVVI